MRNIWKVTGLLVLVFLAGCGHDFMMDAPVAISEGITEVEKGVMEYSIAARLELDNAVEVQQRAIRADLLLNFKAVGSGAVKLEDPELKVEIDKLMGKYETELAGIEQERFHERDRLLKLQSLLQWVRELSRQLTEMEAKRFATVESLKEMAMQQIQNQFKKEGK